MWMLYPEILSSLLTVRLAYIWMIFCFYNPQYQISRNQPSQQAWKLRMPKLKKLTSWTWKEICTNSNNMYYPKLFGHLSQLFKTIRTKTCSIGQFKDVSLDDFITYLTFTNYHSAVQYFIESTAAFMCSTKTWEIKKRK